MSNIIKMYPKTHDMEELALICMRELEAENEYFLRCINKLEDCLQDATNIVISESFYEGVEDYPIRTVMSYTPDDAE